MCKIQEKYDMILNGKKKGRYNQYGTKMNKLKWSLFQIIATLYIYINFLFFYFLLTIGSFQYIHLHLCIKNITSLVMMITCYYVQLHLIWYIRKTLLRNIGKYSSLHNDDYVLLRVYIINHCQTENEKEKYLDYNSTFEERMKRCNNGKCNGKY